MKTSRISKKQIRESIREHYNGFPFNPGQILTDIIPNVFGYDDYEKVERTLLRNGFAESKGCLVLTMKGYKAL